MTSDVMMAGWRDASFYAYPGRAARYHVLVRGLAACNQRERWSNRALPLVEASAIPAADVPDQLRCRRSACSRLFRSVGVTTA